MEKVKKIIIRDEDLELLDVESLSELNKDIIGTEKKPVVVLVLGCGLTSVSSVATKALENIGVEVTQVTLDEAIEEFANDEYCLPIGERIDLLSEDVKLKRLFKIRSYENNYIPPTILNSESENKSQKKIAKRLYVKSKCFLQSKRGRIKRGRRR